MTPTPSPVLSAERFIDNTGKYYIALGKDFRADMPIEEKTRVLEQFIAHAVSEAKLETYRTVQESLDELIDREFASEKEVKKTLGKRFDHNSYASGFSQGYIESLQLVKESIGELLSERKEIHE